jgi:hypothetical protein
MQTMMTIQEIEKIFEKDVPKALMEVNNLLKDGNDEKALHLRLRIHQKLGKHTQAINDCILLLKYFGENEEIQLQKQHLETIVRADQLDVYACTNLHNDPWD